MLEGVKFSVSNAYRALKEQTTEQWMKSALKVGGVLLFLGLLAGSGYGMSHFSLLSSGFYASAGIGVLDIAAFTAGIVARYCLFRDPEYSFHRDLKQSEMDVDNEIVIAVLRAEADKKIALGNGMTMRISSDLNKSELPRISHLSLGKKVVVDHSNDLSLSNSEILTHIYNFAGSRRTARGLANLLHTDVIATVNKALGKVNFGGLGEYNKNYLFIEGSDFKLEREFVFKIIDLENPLDEKLHAYFKAKIIISGALQDLYKNPENLSVRLIYSDETAKIENTIHTELIDSSVEH